MTKSNQFNAWSSTREHSAVLAKHAQNASTQVQQIASTAASSGGHYAKQVGYAFFEAIRKWQDDDAGAMAASVAYYLALSLFPMLLVLTAGLGLVFQYTRLGQDAEVQILATVAEHCSPTLETQVKEVLSQLRVHSVVGGPFGLVAAILAAIGVFYQFERAFDRIWKVPRPIDAHWTHACVRILKQRLSAFLLLTSVGGAVVLIMLANIAVGVVHTLMTQYRVPGTSAIAIVEAGTTLLLNAAVFALLYRWLPKRRIHWVDAFRGGLLASLVWEGGRQLLGAIVIGVRYTAAYGAIGSFIALLLWCYWGVSIIFLGAEYAQVLYDRRRAARRATDTPPSVGESKMEHSSSVAPMVIPFETKALSDSLKDVSVDRPSSAVVVSSQTAANHTTSMRRPTIPRRVAA